MTKRVMHTTSLVLHRVLKEALVEYWERIIWTVDDRVPHSCEADVIMCENG